jgi:hypothetical protein
MSDADAEEVLPISVPGEGSEAPDEEKRPSPVDGLAELFGEVNEYQRRQRERDQTYLQYAGEETYDADLKVAFDTYSERFDLHEGQLVQWKSQMRNLTFPHYGVPAIIVKLLPITPLGIYNPERPVTEVPDMILGILDGDRDFALTYASQARFQPW